MDHYASLCRLCQTTKNFGGSWIDLCSAENGQLMRKLRACTNVSISIDDKLPKRICNSCHKSLNQAFEFKQRCEAVDAQLRHEIAFLEKNNWDLTLAIPPLVKDEDDPIDVKPDPIVLEDVNEEQPDLLFVGFAEPEIDHSLAPELLKVECNQDDQKDGSTSSRQASERGSISEPENEPKVEKPKSKKKRRSKVDDETRKSFSCKVCQETFRSESKLVKHSLEAHGKSPFDCKVCNRNFSKKQHLREHEPLHSGVREFACTQCSKAYATPRGLQAHINEQHNDNQPYVCDQCGQKFSQPSHLRQHYDIHNTEKNFICDICLKAFKSKINLRAHIHYAHIPKEAKEQRKTALGKRPQAKRPYEKAICPYCGKASANAECLKIHLRTHTGEQPYECEICSKRFASRSLWQKHKLVHTDEKPHVCVFCQKAFRQRHHLTTHIKGVHPEAKAFQCAFCPETFVTKGSMRYHERNKHPEEVSPDDGGTASGGTSSVPIGAHIV